MSLRVSSAVVRALGRVWSSQQWCTGWAPRHPRPISGGLPCALGSHSLPSNCLKLLSGAPVSLLSRLGGPPFRRGAASASPFTRSPPSASVVPKQPLSFRPVHRTASLPRTPPARAWSVGAFSGWWGADAWPALPPEPPELQALILVSAVLAPPAPLRPRPEAALENAVLPARAGQCGRSL